MQTASSQFLPFHVPLIEDDDIRAVREVMESGWITTGPKAAQFEEAFASYIGARHAVAVNSGTAALHLALEALGLGEGDEVIVPTLTFAATAEAVIYCKARPVLVDSDPDVFNMDPRQVEHALSLRTRALLPVHFAGHPCEMDSLLQIARARGIRVIEDAAHALPSRYRGKMVGALGDITCFSFYATKSITTGEGGMVTTENDGWNERMRVMRLHGISKDAWKRYTAEGSWRYDILAPGFKYNLTDMQAALGLTQLAKSDAMWLRRSLLAQRYCEALSGLDAFELPTVRPEAQHAWHLFVLRVCPGDLTIHRDRVIEELKLRGIGASVHFIPLHLHPYYRDRWGYRRGDFPVAENYFDRCLSLPLYPAMTDDDQARVIAALTEIAMRYRPLLMPVPDDVVLTRPATRPARPQMPPGLASMVEDETAAAASGDRPSWYRRHGKRCVDVVGSLALLILLLPVLAACALAVSLSSPGPVLFRQRRVGRGGRLFQLLKFRTMRAGAAGPRITAAGDARITPAGRWLRRCKLDELPQLLNVLSGEMSLVGPRPEVEEYVASYSPQQRQVLLARPGITSPASLKYIDEEAVLAAQSDRESYYTSVLLPQKLAIDLAYCREISLAADLHILAATARRLFPGSSRSEPASGQSRAASGQSVAQQAP